MTILKTFAIASLVTFSTLAFTACGGSTSSTEAATDTTAINPADMIQETDNSSENTMQADSAATTTADSTKAGM